MEFCGEIAYETENGSVHSDICWHHNEMVSEDFRRFLHDCLDEWLNKAKGNSAFWLGDYKYFSEFGGES